MHLLENGARTDHVKFFAFKLSNKTQIQYVQFSTADSRSTPNRGGSNL